MIQFQVDDVSPQAEDAKDHVTVGESVRRKMSSLQVEATSDAEVVDFGTGEGWNNETYYRNPTSNAFLDAVHTAYDEHLPLTLRPDDFWICIAQGFAIHVNENAEELRERFVEHEGKKEIHLQRDAFVRGSSDNDWQGLFEEFSVKIGEEIGEHNRKLICADFSTTGVVEKAVSEVVLMDAMKSYFTYGFSTACGFPEITLEGEPEDWHSIYTRARALSEFGLEWWVDSLLPVLESVIQTSEGDPDIEFWRSFYKEGGGSGGPFVNGWVNTLFPYLDLAGFVRNTAMAKWDQGYSMACPNPDQFPNGLSTADVLWDYYGNDFQYQFVGGFVGVEQDAETLGLRPNIGWAIGEKTGDDATS